MMVANLKAHKTVSLGEMKKSLIWTFLLVWLLLPGEEQLYEMLFTKAKSHGLIFVVLGVWKQLVFPNVQNLILLDSQSI